MLHGPHEDTGRHRKTQEDRLQQTSWFAQEQAGPLVLCLDNVHDEPRAGVYRLGDFGALYPPSLLTVFDVPPFRGLHHQNNQEANESVPAVARSLLNFPEKSGRQQSPDSGNPMTCAGGGTRLGGHKYKESVRRRGSG